MLSENPGSVQVAVPINLNSLYTYLLPEGVRTEEVIGKRVLVNFHNRKLRGFAVGPGESGPFSKPLKTILKILDTDPVFSQESYQLASWIAGYYFAGIGEVLSLMVPKGVRIRASAAVQVEPGEPKILNPAQQSVYEGIRNDIANHLRKFYLYGVTGSGKTEIYIRLIEDTLSENKSVIFLVPEIALSYQTLNRLQKKFGPLCAVLHSGLSTTERFSEYMRLFRGEAKIAIGPRSAVFAPVRNPGLIIIDEEHDGSYKSDESPRFHARSVALKRAQDENAILLLGSATPSIESWYFAGKGFFKLYRLNQRHGDAMLPEVRIIEKAGHGLISPELSQEINRRIQKKEQVILLQNRRGFSSLIRCKECSQGLVCPRCSISLTYHKVRDRLVCHHCGYHTSLPDRCPECGCEKLLKIGAGTQKVEDEIASIFPFARIRRIDLDSLKSGHDMSLLFQDIEAGNIDILIGTQMIAKGLHFPGIKFAGIINADLMLNLPDYKSSERTYSLITQVAGRAGREGEQGSVLIQTMNPGHYAIRLAASGNYDSFFREEIRYRKDLEMPPFYRIIKLVIRSRNEASAESEISRLGELLKSGMPEDLVILGPAPSLLQKINHQYRFQILLKSFKIEPLQNHLKAALTLFKTKPDCHLEIDVDPVDLF